MSRVIPGYTRLLILWDRALRRKLLIILLMLDKRVGHVLKMPKEPSIGGVKSTKLDPSLLKFVFSKMATKIDEIFTGDLTFQIDSENFVNFFGLLRKHELYKTASLFNAAFHSELKCPISFENWFWHLLLETGQLCLRFIKIGQFLIKNIV